VTRGLKNARQKAFLLSTPAQVPGFTANNFVHMRYDRNDFHDAPNSEEEDICASFLPHGTTLDELIADGSRVVTAADLWALSLLTHRLLRKLETASPCSYPGFDHNVHLAVLILKSAQAQSAIDPLPLYLAEVAFAVHYFLKNLDLIPDKTPVIGLVDDFAILKRVFSRNRTEIENVIHTARVRI
jgi:hypothetical protein